MLFRLINASITFQEFINNTLRVLVNVYCIVYLDNILIYSKDLKQYKQDVRSILACLRKVGLYINLDKYIFLIEYISFLRFIITIEGLKIELEYIKAIIKWLVTYSIKDILIFLRFISFYYQFITSYFKLIVPLINKLKGNVKGEVELDSSNLSV